MSSKERDGRCEVHWEHSSASCNAEGKSWSGFGFRLANNCQASRAAAFLVLEIPLAHHGIAAKGVGDERISQVMWNYSEGILGEGRY